MAAFFSSVLNSEPIFFVSSFDPAIDWAATESNGLTRSDYKADPLGLRHKLVKKEGHEFIKIELIPPRQVDQLVAFDLAGISVDANGEMLFAGSEQLSPGLRASLGSSLAQPKLALLCIHDAFNLDGWPSPCREPFAANTHILTEEAQQCLPDVILSEIGKLCVQMDELGNVSGSAFDPLLSGESSSDGTNTETTADSVEIPMSDESGAVTGARSQHDPDEMTV